MNRWCAKQPLRAVQDHQPRLLARHSGVLGDQFIGQIEVKLGGEHASLLPLQGPEQGGDRTAGEL